MWNVSFVISWIRHLTVMRTCSSRAVSSLWHRLAGRPRYLTIMIQFELFSPLAIAYETSILVRSPKLGHKFWWSYFLGGEASALHVYIDLLWLHVKQESFHCEEQETRYLETKYYEIYFVISDWDSWHANTVRLYCVPWTQDRKPKWIHESNFV